MVHLFISSMTGYSGKSLITLGLGLLFREKGYLIGYVKPFGTIPLREGSRLVDADADFMRKALDLDTPPDIVSPFVATAEARNDVLEGRALDKFETVTSALASLKQKDVVLIGGAADLFEGSFFGISGMRIIGHLGAKTLIVEPWGGDRSIDSIIGSRELLGDNLIGVVLNKVPETAHDYVFSVVRPYLEKRGIPVFASMHKDILLDSITVRQLNEILGGKLRCCEEGLDEFIEFFSIGAMDVDSALAYFRRTPNKAVITGSSRADIQLAALETSTKCIVLTGGLYVSDLVIRKAEAAGTPVISVTEDTFTTIEKIEAVLGKIRIREQKKVLKTREIVEKEFDFDRLLKILKL